MTNDEDTMAQAIPQVLDALVGSTACHADTALDDESLENIPKLRAVAEWLRDRLYAADRYADSPYASAKQVAKSVVGACVALDDFFFDSNSAYFSCPHCHGEFNVRMWGGEKPVKCVICGKELKDDEE